MPADNRSRHAARAGDLARVGDLGNAPTIDDMSGWYRAAFHGNLAVGRALASLAPTVGPLDDKWLLIEATYRLVTLAGGWAERLDELGVPASDIGRPGPAVVDLADAICADEWPGALATVAGHVSSWLGSLRARAVAGEALHYHDRRLVGTAIEDLEALEAQLAAGGYVSVGPTTVDASQLVVGPPADGPDRTPTGTPALAVRPVPQRTYPPEAVLQREPTPVPPDAGNAYRYAASLHDNYQIEFVSIDIPLRNAAEFADLPLGFYLDMVRHAHDEMRHCWMLSSVLEGFGLALGDFAFVVPDRYELMAEEDLVYRLVVLSRTGESEACEFLGTLIPQLEAAGEDESVRMWQYVLADEIRHARFGNDWLRHLVGDDDQAVADATRRSLERYNAAIEAGRLDRPVKPVDYLTDAAGMPIDVGRRALAGFSPGEIEALTATRGRRSDS